MFIRKVKSEGLAHLSYLVGSDGKAVVIDPRRDCQIYLDIAEQEGFRIVEILETHRNEDYVTGSRELAAATGARIRHGDLDFRYGELIREGEEVDLGQAVLRAIATPGHTPESMSYVLLDRSAGPEPIAVFTGDALFVGEVGRTDLIGHDRIEELATMLYDSLHDKLVPLGPGTIIFPAHGAGSACGGSISNREDSTIGVEQMQNKMLRLSRDAFLEVKRKEKIEKPFYFSAMERINLEGQPILGRFPQPPPLSPDEVAELAATHAILDVRTPPAYASAHIKGSISIPLEVLASYAGWVLRYDLPIILVGGGIEDCVEAVRELLRIGFVDFGGFLRDGMEGWTKSGKPISSFPVIDSHALRQRLAEGNIEVLDVRMEKEWAEGRIEGARHIFVGHLYKRLDEVPRNSTVAVMCSSGLRGSLGASILQNEGFDKMVNVLGGMGGWKKAGFPIAR